MTHSQHPPNAARRIIEAVAEKHGLKPEALRKGGIAPRCHASARAEAMALVRQELGYSYPLIGRVFGGYHHTSVMAAVSRAGTIDWTPAATMSRQELTAAVVRLQEQVEELTRRVAPAPQGR